MAKRVQTPGQIALPQQLQPAASPTERYYRPNISQPTLNTVYDFAPLSNELLRLFSDTNAGKGNAQIAEGEALAANNPELAKEINAAVGKVKSPEEALKKYQDVFGRLVREGKLPEAGSPLFQRGFAQASARSMVGAYHNAVIGRLAELSVLIDENGHPVNPPNPEAILAEEWEKLSDNPALVNFYGRQVAASLKPQVDEGFLAKAATERAEAMTKHYKTLLSNEVAQMVGVLQGQAEVTPGDLQRISDFITTNVHANNVRDPRAVAWQGMEFALKNIANTAGPSEALQMLDMIREVQIDGAAIGKDAEVGVQFENLKQEFSRQEDWEAREETQRKDDDRRAALIAGKQEYIGPLMSAYEKGDNLIAVRNQLAESIRASGKYGASTGEVLEDLFDKVDSLSERGGKSDPGVISQLNAYIARGQLEEADLLWNTAVNGKTLLGEDILKFDQRIEAERSIAPLMQNSGAYQETLGIIRSEGAAKDLHAEAQAQHDDFRRGLEEQYRTERAALARSLRGDNDIEAKLSDFDAKKRSEIRGLLSTREGEIRAAKKAYSDELTKRVFRRVDSTEVIEAAYAQGTISTQEYQQALSTNREATDRRPWYGGADVTAALESLEAEIKASDTDDAQKSRLFTAFNRLFQDTWNAKLDGALKTADPRYLDSTVRAVTRETADEVLGQVGAGITAEVNKVVKKGGSAEKAAAVISDAEALETRARAWAEESKKPDPFSAESAVVLEKVGPGLPESLVKAYTAVLQGEGDKSVSRGGLSWWNVPATAKLDDEIGRTALELLDSPELPDEEKTAAIVRARSLYKLSAEEVLAGEITVRRGDVVRALAMAEAAAIRFKSENAKRAWWNSNQAQVDNYKRNLEIEARALEQKWLREETVDISTAEIDGFTTPLWRSVEEMGVFARTRSDDFNALLKRLKVPTDPTSVQKFIDYQKAAITRTYR